jgi:N-acetylmuramoyl-L-alanine amidase
MKIIVDSGHGGSDPGASGFGTLEKNLNLVFAGLLASKLQQAGIEVDKSLIADKYYSSTELTNLIKRSGADTCISCHNNSFNGSAQGFEAIYSIHSDGRLAGLIAEKIEATGHKVRRTFSRNSTDPSRPNDDYYYIIRLTYPEVETVILEFGFIDNQEDYKLITDPAWQDKLTTAAAAAVVQYAGLSNPPDSGGPEPEQPQTHWAKENNDELLVAGILNSDHTATLDKPATEGMVLSLVNRLRKEFMKNG